MTQITSHIRQDIIIDNETNLTGMVTGNVTVDNASNFIVHGMVNGNVIVQVGATLLVHGTINGNIINSGLCKVFGVVNGKLIDNGGSFDIDSKAHINETF
ncbi:hypothetical protein NTJ28_002499 [Flavobacterium psychrophilum]|nr:hypothetical protein [Flavobacterium psychrophilum]EKT4510888.1 hypothetical protein [Flavobacterium psychrophilum]